MTAWEKHKRRKKRSTALCDDPKGKGLHTNQLAETADLFTNYLSDIERGKSSARPDKPETITDALQCGADDVFCDAIAYGYTARSSRLAEKPETLPEKKRQKVLAVLDILIA